MYFIKYGKICTVLHLFTHAVVTADCRYCWVLITWQYWISSFIAKVWKNVYICKEVHHSYEQKVFQFWNTDPGRRVCSFNNCFLSLVSTEGKIHFKMVWLVMCPYGVPDIDVIQCCTPQIPTAVLTCRLKTRKLWEVVFPMSCIHFSYIYDSFLYKILFITHQRKIWIGFWKSLFCFCYLFVGWNTGSDSKTIVCLCEGSLISELFSGSSSYCMGVLVFFGSQISSDDRSITWWSLKICLKL